MSSPLSSIPIESHDTLNQDMVIRRFCAERVFDEQFEWNDDLFNIEMYSSSFDSSSPPSSIVIEDDMSFVDSFINTNLYDEVVDGNYSVDSAMPLVSMGTPYFEPASIEKGLQLVNLLLVCAEAVSCRDTVLATSTIDQIWPLANPLGDSLRRVSFYFAMGLKSRVSLLRHVGTIATENTPVVTKEEKMEAFHLLYQTTPYIAFGFTVANEAILHASQGKDQLHIVDLGMSHVLQWPSLIQSLASNGECPRRVRITAIAAPGSCLSEIEHSMQLLVNNASTIGMLVEFKAMEEAPSPSLLTAENLELKQGEVLFVNSVMHLHKYVKESRGSLKALLVAIKKLKPTLLTIVEQDANHNGPFFLARFLESLHYYSAVFDSIEASLPRPSVQRMKIEKCYLAEEIRNIVACEGGERVERHERADQWRRQLGRAGFRSVGLSSESQVRMLVATYGCDGYTVGSEKGCLLLGWKGRPIIWASAWQVNFASSS